MEMKNQLYSNHDSTQENDTTKTQDEPTILSSDTIRQTDIGQKYSNIKIKKPEMICRRISKQSLTEPHKMVNNNFEEDDCDSAPS